MVWRDVNCESDAACESPVIGWVDLLPSADPYEILGVSRFASFSMIKVCFRKLAKMYHPDTQHHELTGLAKTRMQQINEAYAVLRCVEKRAAYDRSSAQGHQLQTY
jgi:DnaJ-class molecular chaperone